MLSVYIIKLKKSPIMSNFPSKMKTITFPKIQINVIISFFKELIYIDIDSK